MAIKELLRKPKNKWGWFVTFCTFVLTIPTTGIPSSFGVIFVNLQEEFQISGLMAGWIGSLCFGLFFIISPVSTGIFKRFSHRSVALIGVTLCSLGLLTSSFVPHPVYLFLTYSLMFGIGANFIDNTSLNLIGQYFPRKNSARATCFATLGWSVGSLAMNPLTVILCNRFGWRITYQILSVVMVLVGFPTALAFRPPPMVEFAVKVIRSQQSLRDKASKSDTCLATKKSSYIIEYFKTLLQTCRAPGILLWNISNILLNISLVFPFINMIKFMTTIGIPPKLGSVALIVLGIGDFIGRGLCSLLGDLLPFPTIYLYPVTSLVLGTAVFVLLTITNFTGMVAFSIVAGACIGILNSMLFKVTLDLFGNLLIAEAWTFALVSAGIGVMGGPVIAGATFDSTGNFELSFYIGGSCCFLASILFFAIPVWQRFRGWTPVKSVKSTMRGSSISTAQVTLVHTPPEPAEEEKEPLEIVESFLTTV